jgi:hypothetical protein
MNWTTMTRIAIFLTLQWTLAIAVNFAQEPVHASLKLVINEVLPGAMSSQQYCTLVFADHTFHSEKANIKSAKDTERKIYEGPLSDSQWNELTAIIDNPQFRDLKIPRTVPPLIMQDTHPYTISVARDKDFQNMEFLDSKSLKPYESQIKPLLQWWKALRGQHMSDSKAAANPRCALDNTHAIYSQ